MKSQTVTANLSGLDMEDPKQITISHTADMYYRVTPVNGYIVIQNANTDRGILSITNLRTTNMTKPAQNGGILPVAPQEAVDVMTDFTEYMLAKQKAEPLPEEPEEILPSVEDQLLKNQKNVETLFLDIRQWLETA